MKLQTHYPSMNKDSRQGNNQNVLFSIPLKKLSEIREKQSSSTHTMTKPLPTILSFTLSQILSSSTSTSSSSSSSIPSNSINESSSLLLQEHTLQAISSELLKIKESKQFSSADVVKETVLELFEILCCEAIKNRKLNAKNLALIDQHQQQQHDALSASSSSSAHPNRQQHQFWRPSSSLPIGVLQFFTGFRHDILSRYYSLLLELFAPDSFYLKNAQAELYLSQQQQQGNHNYHSSSRIGSFSSVVAVTAAPETAEYNKNTTLSANNSSSKPGTPNAPSSSKSNAVTVKSIDELEFRSLVFCVLDGSVKNPNSFIRCFLRSQLTMQLANSLVFSPFHQQHKVSVPPPPPASGSLLLRGAILSLLESNNNTSSSSSNSHRTFAEIMNTRQHQQRQVSSRKNDSSSSFVSLARNCFVYSSENQRQVQQQLTSLLLSSSVSFRFILEICQQMKISLSVVRRGLIHWMCEEVAARTSTTTTATPIIVNDLSSCILLLLCWKDSSSLQQQSSSNTNNGQQQQMMKIYADGSEEEFNIDCWHVQSCFQHQLQQRNSALEAVSLSHQNFGFSTVPFSSSSIITPRLLFSTSLSPINLLSLCSKSLGFLHKTNEDDYLGEIAHDSEEEAKAFILLKSLPLTWLMRVVLEWERTRRGRSRVRVHSNNTEEEEADLKDDVNFPDLNVLEVMINDASSQIVKLGKMKKLWLHEKKIDDINDTSSATYSELMSAKDSFEKTRAALLNNFGLSFCEIVVAFISIWDLLNVVDAVEEEEKEQEIGTTKMISINDDRLLFGELRMLPASASAQEQKVLLLKQTLVKVALDYFEDERNGGRAEISNEVVEWLDSMLS